MPSIEAVQASPPCLPFAVAVLVQLGSRAPSAASSGDRFCPLFAEQEDDECTGPDTEAGDHTEEKNCDRDRTIVHRLRDTGPDLKATIR